MHSEAGPSKVEDGKTTDASVGSYQGSNFTVIWAAPILPGKAEAWRRFMQELMGNQRPAFDDICRRLKIRAMRSWVTETARGEIGVIAVVASQPKQIMAALSTSDRPFGHWFRAQLATLQGLDISAPPRLPPSDLVLDWNGSAGDHHEGGGG